MFGPFEAQCDSLIRTIGSDSGDFQVSCPRVRRLLEEEPSYGVEVHPTDEVAFVLHAPLIPFTNPDETASNTESVSLCKDQSSEYDSHSKIVRRGIWLIRFYNGPHQETSSCVAW